LFDFDFDFDFFDDENFVELKIYRKILCLNFAFIQVARLIGADFMYYQKQEDMENCVRQIRPQIQTFESSCFDGKYVTGDIDLEYLSDLASHRNEDRHTTKRAKAQYVVEMHNKTGVNGQ
jgi:hypothetical protein